MRCRPDERAVTDWLTVEYLGSMPDRIPTPSEQRALPVSALGRKARNDEFSGSLLAGWRIEISRVAPQFVLQYGRALGRPR